MRIDEHLVQQMNAWLDKLKTVNKTDSLELQLTEDQIKMRIMAENLRGLADVILMVDDKRIEIDFKKTALGLLGSADWLEEG